MIRRWERNIRNAISQNEVVLSFRSISLYVEVISKLSEWDKIRHTLKCWITFYVYERSFVEISSLTSYAYWIRHVNTLSYICSSLELLAISKIVVSRHTNREWNMGVRWYRITLQLLNSNEWGVEVQRTSEVSSWTRELKFHIYQQPCIILFII